MSFLEAWWDREKRPKPAPLALQPLCLTVDIVGIGVALMNHDEWLGVRRDLARVMAGYPTKMQEDAAFADARVAKLRANMHEVQAKAMGLA